MTYKDKPGFKLLLLVGLGIITLLCLNRWANADNPFDDPDFTNMTEIEINQYYCDNYLTAFEGERHDFRGPVEEQLEYIVETYPTVEIEIMRDQDAVDFLAWFNASGIPTDFEADTLYVFYYYNSVFLTGSLDGCMGWLIYDDNHLQASFFWSSYDWMNVQLQYTDYWVRLQEQRQEELNGLGPVQD